MSNISKKIVAIITVLTVSVWLAGPGVSQALTTDELMAQINQLQAQLLQLQAQLAQLQQTGGGAVAACVGVTSFARNLSQGMSGDDVKCLQGTLNQSADTQVAVSGVGSAGKETNFFGPLTKAAVVKFQEKYASSVLTPLGLTAGTGYFGPATRAKANSMLSTGLPTTPTTPTTPPPTGPAGENKVQLAADTPVAASVAKGAQDVIFAKINFCAAAEANTISKIVLKRGGIAADADIANVKLYEGATQVGSTQAVNSTTHKAAFASLNWTISANSCKALTIKANISTTATQGDTVKFEIEAASDITSTVALDGVFPIISAGMTIAGISAGLIEVSTTTPSGGSIIAGGVEQAIAGFKLYASSTEAVKVHSIKVTEVGSSVDDDLANIKLWYGSTQLGSTVAALTGGKATFDLSANPLEILAGSSKTVKVTVDVGSSTGIKDRTIAFEITDNTYVTVYGTNSGGKVVNYGATVADDLWPQNSAPVSITLGSLTVAKDESYSPSAQDYTKGTNQNNIIAFKFSTGANEAIRITQIKLQEASTTLADSDVSNVTLYDAVSGEQLKDTAGNLIPATGMISGFVTFGSYTTGLDTTGLLDIPASSFKTILVKSDVPSGAATNDVVLGYKINNPTTDIKADGLSSKNDLGANEINGGTTTQIPGTDVFHDIIAQGTLTVSASPDTPAAATYAVGTTDYVFAKFDFITTGEAITISQLDILFATDTDGIATTTNADSADINNVRLYDGATLLKTDPTISSGKAEFGLSLTVAKNSTKTITVKGDIPVGADAAYLTAHIDSNSYITASGQASAQTITAAAASWSVKGNLMTKGAPTLTITTAVTPVSQTYIKSQAGALMTTLYLAASAAEDIKVTKIKILGDSTTSATVAALEFTEADRDDFLNMTGNIKLYDGATQIGNTIPAMTNDTNFDYADFTGLNLVVPKGQTKTIDVKLDILNSSGTVYYHVGLSTTTDVSGNGVQSGTAMTVNMGAGVTGAGMLFGSSGTLNVALDAGTPVSAQIIEGTTGVNAATFGKWKFTANNEAIQVTKLFFDVTNSSAATGTSVAYAESIQTGSTFYNMATSATDPGQFAFNYSINGGATQTCSFAWDWEVGATTVENLLVTLGDPASSTNCVDEIVLLGTTSNDGLNFSASGTDYSLQISDSEVAASNTAAIFQVGLKYGGTESLGATAGNNTSIVKASLYDGSTWLADAYVGAVADNALVFGCDTCATLTEVPKGGNKVLSLKVDLSDYVGAIEGSTLIFQLGNSTAASDTDYVYGKGKSSGTALATSTILDSASAVGAIGALTSNAMYLYASKPAVSLNAASPSGARSVGSNSEIFRFDVTAPSTGFDLTMNAIRFTLTTGNATATWDKLYNLYRSDDLSTVVGYGISWANATTSDSTGWVAVYPSVNNVISSGTTKTYVLKGNTNEMNYDSTTKELLTVSIETDDFYWDDGVIGNANSKTLNLPVTGNTLEY